MADGVPPSPDLPHYNFYYAVLIHGSGQFVGVMRPTILERESSGVIFCQMLIDPIAIGLLFLLAALMKAHSKQWEHSLTRVFVAVTYLWIGGFHPAVEAARIFSRYFVFLLAIVEILSWSIMRYRSWKSKSSPH